MKKILKSIFALILLLQVFSCIDFSDNIKKEKLNDDSFKAITINEEYEVKLPKYMKEAQNLNDEASLQYQNIFKETYFVVIDEPKEEFKEVFLDIGEYDESLPLIKNYKNAQLEFFKESLTTYEFINESSKKINGKDAEVVAFDGKVQGVIYDISYLFTFVEGDDKAYMLMAWTLKNKRDKYQETFEYISDSFTVLN
ncbi:hypothetical protein ACFSQJ_00045 [Croceitalea marina]|uniref:Lipoprotein n=1 Tax=Croceitalea marina TaxID=1775166 RepID=A0ABW5MQ76_9FLAO